MLTVEEQAGSRMTIAGQIALVPATLSLPTPKDIPKELALSLQHAMRVVQAEADSGRKGEMEGCLCWLTSNAWTLGVEVAKELWADRAGQVRLLDPARPLEGVLILKVCRRHCYWFKLPSYRKLLLWNGRSRNRSARLRCMKRKTMRMSLVFLMRTVGRALLSVPCGADVQYVGNRS